jgi:hypothetical protein
LTGSRSRPCMAGVRGMSMNALKRSHVSSTTYADSV